ncbi:MAG TPA: hypothetical protein VFV45_07790, partial [Rubrobacteraceae bacterium]|nr:hypothetical protein [Rubrobacteraceae bacterium]
ERQPDIEVVGAAGSLSEVPTMPEGVDVAILGRVLPEGDHLQLISDLREARPGVKVLIISALEELGNPQEALEARPDRHSHEVGTLTELTKHAIS